MVLHVPLIQPKRELIDVTVQMLLARVMVNTMQAAFQNRPHAFYRVRACESASVFAVEVIDRIVSEEQVIESGVRAVLVGVESRTDFNIVLDRLLNSRQFCIRYRQGFRSTATLTHSENGLLTDRAAT